MGTSQIAYKRTAALIPFSGNARTHSESQIAQIAASIKEFGWTNPILTDGDRVIAGHGRLAAAVKLGMETVPCLDLVGLSPSQARAYVIADNRLALNAGWDDEILSAELMQLQDADFDLKLLGFSDDELADLLAPVNPWLTDPDATPAPPVTPVTVFGDVWMLGAHRIACGDATSVSDIESLMAGQKADLVFTDPPYNVAYSGRGQNELGTIKNDDMSDADFEQFMRDVFAGYLVAMKPLACIYVCHPDGASGPKLAFEKTFAEAFHKAATIIWAKQSAGMGWQDYRAQHEPILYGWKESGKGKHFFCGDRSKTTVWSIGRDAQATYKHPTQKPVALAAEAIGNSSKGEDVIADFFSGSGSTLIACEQTGRAARVMELDAKYVDVAVIRWQDFTGQKAVLESTGETFAEVAAGRLETEVAA